MGPNINMNVHHLSPQPAAALVEGGEPFVALEVSAHPAQVNLFLHTPAECDALIKAAVAAKDLLLSAQAGTCCARDQSFRCAKQPGHDGGHATYVHGVAVHRWGGGPAPLPPAHGPNHIDNAGHAYGVTAGEVPGPVPCPCGPGRCTCGATVSAAGVVTPAGAS